MTTFHRKIRVMGGRGNQASYGFTIPYKILKEMKLNNGDTVLIDMKKVKVTYETLED